MHDYGSQALAEVPGCGWVQAVPLPYQGLWRVTCQSCGQVFKGKLGDRRYEAHWLVQHSDISRQLYARQVNATHPGPERMLVWDDERMIRELARLFALLENEL